MHHRLQDAKPTNPARSAGAPESFRFDPSRVPGRDTQGQNHTSAPTRGDDPAGRLRAHTNPGVEQNAGVAIRDHLAQSLGANRVRRYLNERTRLAVLGDGSVEISAGDAFTLDMIQRRLGEALRIAAQFALGTTEPRIGFRIDEALQPTRTEDAGASGDASKTHTLGNRVQAPETRPPAPRCPRLEEYLVGASNRLAFESVRQAIESSMPGAPVFVHGSCGVGKTHLLRGATMLARTLRPGCKVRYTTGEAFTNAFVTAIRTRSVDAFQKKYRGLDLLCIDDIHLMAGKQATQHELLQILNTLSLGGARIILASDAHPRSIARLDQALTSRFSAGLVVRVDEPDPELARRLVHQIAALRGVSLDEAGVRVICERVGVGRGASVRDLEGAVLQVHAVCRLLDRDQSARRGLVTPTASHLRQALALRGGEEQLASTAPISIDSIIRTVCTELSVSKCDLRGKGRQKKVVLARELIVHITRQLTSKSFPEIAHELGRSNHSTVITAAKRFRDRLSMPEPLRVDCPFDGLPVSELTQRLMSSVQRA